MHEAAYERDSVTVIRDFSPVPSITADRYKALQILSNLLQNAKHACDDKSSRNSQVTLRIRQTEAGRVTFEVEDNGVGIPPENLTRIFSFGFSTRRDGHGFGLHSGSLAAKEMGGSLTVHSPGTGHGATFRLELPLQHGSGHTLTG